MLRVAVLLQLTLWVTTIHAFFPWRPCEVDRSCAGSHRRGVDQKSSSQRAALPPRGQSFDILQRAPHANEDTESRTSRAIRLAVRLAAKRGATGLAGRSNKYSVVTPLAPTAPNSAGIFQDGSDFSYFIQVKVGSSGTPMYVLLDSGAGTTWVMGTSCKSQACKMHDSFGPEHSKTLKMEQKTFTVTYGTGNVTGQIVRDTISVAGTTLDMTFGITTDTSDDFIHFPFDGILGLSMSKGSTDNFMAAALDKKEITAKIFSVSLGRASDGVNNGQITFGGVDPTKFTGDISYTPVAAEAKGDWAIPLQDLGHDGASSGIKDRHAIIDTGTSMVFGPPSDVAAFHRLIPGAKSTDNITYEIPCSTKPITAKFSGVTYTIPAKDWQQPWGGACVSNVYGVEVVKGSWLFGDMFLKNVYTVFDIGEKRLGFAAKAPLPATPNDSNAKPTGTGPGLTPAVSPFVPAPDGPGSPAPGSPKPDSSAAPSVAPAQVSPGNRLTIQKYLSVLSTVAITIGLVA